MKTVKFGIIGIGNMGSSHVKSIEELKRAELTAVCDLNSDAFERIAPETREKISCFTDTEEFFAKADIDAVIIAVPHYSHPDLAIRAMECGKHIIVEKPIAVHKSEAMRMIEAAKKYPELKKSAMFNQRTIELHKKIKSLIDSGELGQLRRVNWTITNWFRTQRYYDSGDWRASWRGEGGGVLTNQAPHQLDLMQWFFGLPSKVRATAQFGKYHNIEVEDEVNAYLEYESGLTANFITSTGEAPGTNRLEIVGERGRLVYETGAGCSDELSFRRNIQEMTEYSHATENTFITPEVWECKISGSSANDKQHRDIIENVTNAILDDSELIAPMEEGIRGLELGNAMLLSGLKSEEVTLPIDEKEFAARLEQLIATSSYQKKTPVKSNSDDFGSSFGN